MKTKERIKDQSRQLFNEKGVMNVTLREVADALQKSYGNVTYHYRTKEHVIKELFEDLNEELSSLQKLSEQYDLMHLFLEFPKYSYDITRKYLFLHVDYVELRRNYPEFFKTVHILNEQRKKSWLMLMNALKDSGYLKSDLTNDDLEYIIFQSVSVRAGYFQMHDVEQYDKVVFVSTVNRLLKPYLSEKGLAVYAEIEGG